MLLRSPGLSRAAAGAPCAVRIVAHNTSPNPRLSAPCAVSCVRGQILVQRSKGVDQLLHRRVGPGVQARVPGEKKDRHSLGARGGSPQSRRAKSPVTIMWPSNHPAVFSPGIRFEGSMLVFEIGEQALVLVEEKCILCCCLHDNLETGGKTEESPAPPNDRVSAAAAHHGVGRRRLQR
jgi:hypothetical protein